MGRREKWTNGRTEVEENMVGVEEGRGDPWGSEGVWRDKEEG